MNMEEGFFKTYDGLNLYYRVQLAPTLGHPVFLMHGLHEHSGRYMRIIQKLNLPGFSYLMFDQRGHGRSEGPKGYALGVDEYVKDMRCFWQWVISRWPGIPRSNAIWYGHSFGGLWTIRYTLQFPESVRAVVLTSPCFGIRSWVYSLDRIVASFAPLFPKSVIHSFVYRKLLSHSPEERKLHEEDTLIHNCIGLMLLKDALKIMPETVRRAGEFTKPLLMLISGKEYVVQKKQSLEFFKRAGSPDKTQYIFSNHYHELHREVEWQEPIRLIREFFLKHSEPVHAKK